MPTYTIDMTDIAEEDLAYYRVFERRMIVNEILSRLMYEPDAEALGRKILRANPLAKWELKLGKYRVFYEIDTVNLSVSIISIGHKEHNVLYVQGKLVKL